ncbi:MAG: Gfo/Idh/MocA family oxidoreductase [Victivallales bacterium]|jgi:predicted dehydrogenase|nr:Gfo/Idh/MocA family oxidoreductase [Victivallales bacterium]
MGKTRIGLIGLGFMGSTHFRIYREMENAEIVALADVDPVKRRGDISSVIGNIGNADNSVPLDLTGVHVYESAYDLINDPDVDVVDICVPTENHAPYILAALAAGKHVHSEKPLCRTPEEAAAIRAAVAQAPGFFSVGLCVRYWPEYDYLHDEFKKGSFGKLLSATFRRLSPSIDGNNWENWFMDGKRSGGALLDMHTHDTDFICYLLGVPKAVTSIGRTILSSNQGIDHVITFYHYGDGTVVEAEGCWGAPKTTPFEMTFQVICEKATIRLMAEGFKVYWTDGRVESPEVEATTGWHRELKYFVECVQKGVKPDHYQTIDSVYQSFLITQAEQQSIDNGSVRTEVKQA